MLHCFELSVVGIRLLWVQRLWLNNNTNNFGKYQTSVREVLFPN
uniref:Uncharacterized protein n=1 Tax=Anguilla anguilla TaxID=7936 RepID=A0A0E9TID5_ANGAN